MGPGALSTILTGLPNLQDPRLLVGYGSSDDASVYQISEDLAIIQTVDFFTPIVDDPYMFGQVAAANALSDVYAMGGEPRLAMNLLCMPNCLSPETIHKILEGGHEKAMEAGCIIAGGHTIQDNEPKYGLSVMGVIHPDHILKNVGARPGDVLVLTKALGTGILTTGIKLEMVTPAEYEAVTASMATLNARSGRDVASASNVHACTDVTGFGLLGHAYEMADGSDVTIRLQTGTLPLLPGARALAEQEIKPGGIGRNLDYVMPHTALAPGIDPLLVDLCADPQTSGGLLVSLPEEDAEALLKKLRLHAPQSAIIGRVEPRSDTTMILE